MKRYFFDVASPSHIRFDYHGRDLAGLKDVRELAELIALDLASREDVDSADVEVQVRTIAGTKIFSIAVAELEAKAA
jgi:hypothetical protein